MPRLLGLLSVLILLPIAAAAECNFSTALKAAELQKLYSVLRIDVRVNKYKRWVANAAAIVSDDAPAIKPQFKKKFQARVLVHYPFGNCRFKAVIRQNGDWKDHIIWDGYFRQSLDVKLEDGNIGGVVRFKLLIPETRKGDNEVFATQLLRHLGYLAPRTAILKTRVNGEDGVHLFQEKQAKELLEAHGRREGPMFEGDETLEWTNGERTYASRFSGSRIVNDKWMSRGESSAVMSLRAFQRLQSLYLYAAQHTKEAKVDFRLPEFSDRIRQRNYETVLYAMNGEHAAAFHNRKFYWNALRQNIEPIYYDGNTYFRPLQPETLFSGVWRNLPQQHYLKAHKSVDFKAVAELIEGFNAPAHIAAFAKLSNVSDEDAERIFERNFRHMRHNLAMLEAWLAKSDGLNPSPSYDLVRDQYVADTTAHGPDQIVIAPDPEDADLSDGLDVLCLTGGACPIRHLDLVQLVEVMSENRLDDRRVVLVAHSDTHGQTGQETQVGELVVRHAAGASVAFDSDANKVTFTQSRPDDWFFIREADLGDVTLEFVGLPPDPDKAAPQQRFNALGLTGCLTLYDVALEGTVIQSSDGGCEDSVNIVSGHGRIAALSVARSFADAIDMDFSDLTLDEVTVEVAGNDCLDVSGGTYRVEVARLFDCQDKGLSVGEASRFQAADTQIVRAQIGVSSKDWSHTKLDALVVRNAPVCAEAYQKKTEFGGALLKAGSPDCGTGGLRRDAMSVITGFGDVHELSN